MSFNEIYDFFEKGFSYSLNIFFDMEKRVHYVYLLSSLVLAFYVYLKTNAGHGFFKYVFKKEAWWSATAFTDYFFLLFNGFLKVFLIAPFVIYGVKLAFWVNEYCIQWFGYPSNDVSKFWILILYTFTMELINDFGTYIVHYGFHKGKLLWPFHKTHHSSTALSPITQYRIHPFELFVNNAKAILIFGIVTGYFDYLSNHTIGYMTFFGVKMFTFIFLAFGANLRHSHIQLKYFDWLEYIFISPFMHQIHHSEAPEHYNKNLGAKLAIWDWLFGTLVRSKEVESLKVGIGDRENIAYNSFWKNLLMPFRDVWNRKV